jgi:hypothetical protein
MINILFLGKNKPFILFAILLVSVFLDGHPASGAEPTFFETPVLFVREPAKDVGTMVEGTIIRHTFLLQNKGNTPLVIHRVDPGCSCTRVVHDPQVKPNRNSFFRVRIDTAGQTGTWTKNIKVFSNDPLSPEIRLTITARVQKSISMVPDRVFFNGTAGPSLDQVVTIKAPDSRPFELTLYQSRLSDQVGFYIEHLENKYLLHIRHKAEAPESDRGRIVLSTDIPHRPRLTIPVFSRIRRPGLTAFPDSIDFGRMVPSVSRYPVRSINLKYFNGTPPLIRSKRMEPDMFEIKSVPIKALGILRLEIQPRITRFKPGIYETRLQLIMDVPENEKIDIPVRMELKSCMEKKSP